MKDLLSSIKKSFIFLFSKVTNNATSNEIYYINGPDLLPPPLSKNEEARIISQLPSDDAKSILIEHNLRLVVYISKRFENTGIYIEDLISIGTIGLIKAINTFCTDKNIKLQCR